MRNNEDDEIVIEDKKSKCDCNDEHYVTLLEQYENKRKKLLLIGVLIIAVPIIITALLQYVLPADVKEALGLVIMVCLVVGIVLLVKRGNLKKEMQLICPCCNDAFGEKYDEELVATDGYVTATEGFFGQVYIDEHITNKEYDVYYGCPKCNHTWKRTESSY
ncbi:MAG: hypothetical protein IJZ29_02405 [Clostridia bacterium]|nr:hypothetical protein [Clostridia bacterium]